MASFKQLKKQYLKKIDLTELEILISFITDKPKEFILTHPEYKLKPSQESKLKKLIKKRLAGEPIAYLIGEKEFYGLNFKINRNVLVPRPETELIVNKALILAREIQSAHFSDFTAIVDVGTGSGCIIVALAKILSHSPVFEFYAIDISRPALALARQNAKLHQVDDKINFLAGDLLQPFLNILKHIKNFSIIITANLPYLTIKQIKNSPTIQAEPKLALDGGLGGLKYYRRLVKQLKKPLFDTLPWAVFFEIDPEQKEKVKKIIKEEISGCRIKFYKDLAGYTRIGKIFSSNLSL